MANRFQALFLCLFLGIVLNVAVGCGDGSPPSAQDDGIIENVPDPAP